MGFVAEFQVLSIYKKNLVWDTGWTYRYDKAEDGTGEPKSHSRELKKAYVLA